MLTCPNSLLFRVRTSLRHTHPLFSSLSALSLHLSVPVSSASHLPHSMTSHILITALLSKTSDSFPCLSYLSASFSPSKSVFFLLMRADTDSCGLRGFCAVSYMFRHVKELCPRMELHAQIPSAPTTFQKALLSQPQKKRFCSCERFNSVPSSTLPSLLSF